MFSRTGPKAFKADLKNTLQLCKFLGNPEKKFPSVHIAGTNGKGSVTHMLAAIFQQHGFKTGLYTSPHLRDFRERIRIDGKMISKRAVVDFVDRTLSVAREIKPSFFELTFAMAVDYFANEKVDIAIIETGLGGRLDSTNVVMPVLSVITNIGMDHMDVLGDTLDKIAFEKAGIIKKNTPVVIGEFLSETKPVFLKKAKEENAPVYFASQLFEAKASEHEKYVDVVNKLTGKHSRYYLDLKGSYQEKNLVTVLQTIELLSSGFRFSSAKVHMALSHVMKATGLEGRWQIVHRNPMVVLDVAHNADGIRYLVHQVENCCKNKLHIVMGMVKDKDVTAVLKQMPGDAIYHFTNAHIARAMPSEDFRDLAGTFGLKGQAFDKVNDAVADALYQCSKEDMVLVCGSVFVVGEVDMKEIRKEIRSRRHTCTS